MTQTTRQATAPAHRQSGPTFWFAGAQDALSALLVDQSDFDGVFSTGFGVSASLLGQPDMELYTLSENLQVVDHMAQRGEASRSSPTADTGYGNVLNVARTVRGFEKAGVCRAVDRGPDQPQALPGGGGHLAGGADGRRGGAHPRRRRCPTPTRTC